jgi:acetate---CoA ligase (ADP-forming) subunit beta
MEECEKIFQQALQEGRSSLLLSEARKVCNLHHIPTPNYYFAKSLEETVKKGHQLGFPVVLKILSPQISHKSDVGGVILNTKNEDELKHCYKNLINQVNKNKPTADILGVVVEKMLPPSIELIVGGIKDSQFGPCVMFGMGGIFAEVYDDVAFRVAPLDEIDISILIDEIKGSKILKGFRGKPPMDRDSIEKILLNVSSLMIKHNEITQLDLNPVIVYPDSAIAADSRIVLHQTNGGHK